LVLFRCIGNLRNSKSGIHYKKPILMKPLILFAFLFSIALAANAQVPKAMPPDANEFYEQSMPLLRSPVKNFILQSAKVMEHRKSNTDSLTTAFHKNPLFKGMSNADIEGLEVLVMVQASLNTDAELKKMVLEIGRKNDKTKANTPESNKEQDAQLQKIMDRKSDMAEQVSYTMKKITGNERNIINNLK